MELLESLHNIALEMKKNYEASFVTQIHSTEYSELFHYDESPRFEVTQGDML